jgi:hypothetical protein
LGLDPEEYSELCAKYDLGLSVEVVYPWQDPRVLELLADPEFQERATTTLQCNRVLLEDYLSSRGVYASNNVGIVDIGWRGTIQDNLASLCSPTHVQGFYLGLQQFLNAQPRNASKCAFGPNANLSDSSVELLDAVALIEMLCNSPHGSVTGYERQKGHVKAVRLIDDGENKVFDDFVQYFQRGAVAATKIWAQAIDTYSITSSELSQGAISLWKQMIVDQGGDLGRIYASLKHNEIFGVGGFVDKGLVPSTKKLLLGIVSKETRRDVILYLKQNQWPAGVRSRADLTKINKTLLILALTGARAYKRVLHWRQRKKLG